MNDFNKGINYAFEYIIENLTGKSVNGNLKPAITKSELLKLKEQIHKKCNYCPKPCERDWCCTKD